MPLYFVETTVSEQRMVLCRWADRLFLEGRRVQILVDSTPAAQFLDQALWTFSQASFLPHAVFNPERDEPQEEPVLIVIGPRKLSGFDVLLCDCPTGLEIMVQFETVVHFVLRDDAERRQGSRLLWQEAKERGLQLVHVAYAPPE